MKAQAPGAEKRFPVETEDPAFAKLGSEHVNDDEQDSDAHEDKHLQLRLRQHRQILRRRDRPRQELELRVVQERAAKQEQQAHQKRQIAPEVVGHDEGREREEHQ